MKRFLLCCLATTLVGCAGFNGSTPIAKPNVTEVRPIQPPSINELLRQANADLTASLVRMQQAIKSKSNNWGARSAYDIKIAREQQLQEQLRIVILGLEKQASAENTINAATGKSTPQQKTVETFNESDIKLSAEKIEYYCKTDIAPTLCINKYNKANNYCFSLVIKKTPLRNNELNKDRNRFDTQQIEPIYNMVELKQNFRNCILTQVQNK